MAFQRSTTLVPDTRPCMHGHSGVGGGRAGVICLHWSASWRRERRVGPRARAFEASGLRRACQCCNTDQETRAETQFWGRCSNGHLATAADDSTQERTRARERELVPRRFPSESRATSEAVGATSESSGHPREYPRAFAQFRLSCGPARPDRWVGWVRVASRASARCTISALCSFRLALEAFLSAALNSS